MIYGIRSDHGIPPEQDSSAKASTAANRTPIHIIDSDGSLLLRSARWGSMGLFCKHIIAIKASLINHLRPGSTECPDCDPDRALVSIQSYDPPTFFGSLLEAKGRVLPILVPGIKVMVKRLHAILGDRAKYQRKVKVLEKSRNIKQ